MKKRIEEKERKTEAQKKADDPARGSACFTLFKSRKVSRRSSFQGMSMAADRKLSHHACFFGRTSPKKKLTVRGRQPPSVNDIFRASVVCFSPDAAAIDDASPSDVGDSDLPDYVWEKE